MERLPVAVLHRPHAVVQVETGLVAPRLHFAAAECAAILRMGYAPKTAQNAALRLTCVAMSVARELVSAARVATARKLRAQNL